MGLSQSLLIVTGFQCPTSRSFRSREPDLTVRHLPVLCRPRLHLHRRALPLETARSFRDLDPRPKVLVMGQSLWGLSLSLQNAPDLRVRWTAPNSLKRELNWAPSVLVYPSHTTERVRWIVEQVSPRTRLVAVGQSGLIKAQEEGADAVFCVRFEDRIPTWTPQQLRALITGLKRPLWNGWRRPIQATRNSLSIRVQGTYSGYQVGWFSDRNPVVVKSTENGIVCEATSAGREVLRVLFRDARVRTFGGVDHPLREVSGFLEGLPKEHLDLALQFPDYLLNGLELLGREPRAISLHRLNPSLYFLIVLALGQGRMHLEEAVEAVLTKQRVVLGRLLDLPGKASRGVNKIAKRMDFSGELDVFALDRLRFLLRQDRFVKRWLGWAKVPFVFFSRNEPALSRSLWLRESSKAGTGAPQIESADFYMDALRLGRTVHEDLRQLERCSTSADVDDLHNDWLELLYVDPPQEEARPSRPVRFRGPPIPGSEGIEFIPDRRSLYKEGKVMHHCVYIYLDSVLLGKSAIYRVLSPERATLRLARRSRRESWYIAELKGPCNKKVQFETVVAVHAWLDAAQAPPAVPVTP